MSQIKAPQSVSQSEDLESLKRFTSQTLDAIISEVNGRLNFVDNIQGTIQSFVFSGPGVEVSVDHGLGKVPTGYIVISLSTAMTVYDGSTANSNIKLYLRSSVAGTARVFVF